MAKNMTEGNPVKHMISFAFPLLLGNLFQQTYNIVDAAIVGRYLGPKSLAAVGASSSVQFLVLGFCIGICAGFAIPVAQRFGAKEYKSMRGYVFNGAVLTALVGIIVTLICVILCTQILHLLLTPDDIFKNAYIYLVIIFAGIPFSLLYNYLSGILRAIGDSRTPFLFLAISVALNIILDLFLIIVVKLGCAGAAIATIAAQGVSGIMCLAYIKRKIKLLHLSKKDCHFNGKFASRLLVMGVPMGLQFSITAIGSMVMQSANNGLGSVYISAFTAAMRIKQLFMCPFDALATAVSTFCSQNLGAGKIERIKLGIKKGVMIGVLYGIFAGVILICSGRILSLMFVSSEAVDVLDASAKYLACLGFFYWALGILNVCRLCVQGIGYSGRAVLSGAVEMVARIFVSSVFVPIYGFNAICFADQAAWVMACMYIVPVCIWCINKEQRNKKVV